MLDLTGDIGEPDVGPQRIDLTVDEATGTKLATATGRGGRVLDDRVLRQRRQRVVAAEPGGARRARADEGAQACQSH